MSEVENRKNLSSKTKKKTQTERTLISNSFEFMHILYLSPLFIHLHLVSEKNNKINIPIQMM